MRGSRERSFIVVWNTLPASLGSHSGGLIATRVPPWSLRGRNTDVTRTTLPRKQMPPSRPREIRFGGYGYEHSWPRPTDAPRRARRSHNWGGGGTGGRLEESKDSFLLYFLAFDELYNLLEPLVANISSKFLRLTRHIYIYRPVGESQAALKFPGPHETVFLLSFIFTSHNGCNNVTCFSAAFERVPLTRHLNVG